MGQRGHGQRPLDRRSPWPTLLRRAGVKPSAVQVTFNGLDQGPLPSVPDFVKTLEADHAMSQDVLVAYEMNGAALPMLNGFPARLVVPGWYATYWVKALSDRSRSLSDKFDGYWMAKAYKIPANPEAAEAPRLACQCDGADQPHESSARSSFCPIPTDACPVGRPCALEGIAFDGGRGIRQVEVSADGDGLE